MPRNSVLVLNYVTLVQTTLYHALYIFDNTRTLEDVGCMLTMSTSNVKTNQPDAPPLTPGNALRDLHKHAHSRSESIDSNLNSKQSIRYLTVNPGGSLHILLGSQ